MFQALAPHQSEWQSAKAWTSAFLIFYGGNSTLTKTCLIKSNICFTNNYYLLLLMHMQLVHVFYIFF